MRANLQPPEAVAASVAFFFSLGDRSRAGFLELTQLNERQLEQESLVPALAIMQIAFIGQLNSLIQRSVGTLPGCFAVSVADRCADFKKHDRAFIFADQQIAEVRGQPRDDMLSVEPFLYNLVQDEQACPYVSFQNSVRNAEIIFVVQHIEVLDHGLVGNVSARVADYLIEDRQSVAHPPVGFLCDDVQRFGFGFYLFLVGYILQMFYGVDDRDA